jgi:hypothetical protein
MIGKFTLNTGGSFPGLEAATEKINSASAYIEYSEKTAKLQVLAQIRLK